ncbi:MAG: hypothetical protein FWH40_00465 [Coriobacteriia bacterium]|nr:hypothetical protein [Coriobacteriia bacterium]
MALSENQKAEIKQQIAVYQKEIDNVTQAIEIMENDLYRINQSRSEIGGPGAQAQHARISAQEQQVLNQRNQIASRLPQLSFELERLKAMLNS